MPYQNKRADKNKEIRQWALVHMTWNTVYYRPNETNHHCNFLTVLKAECKIHSKICVNNVQHSPFLSFSTFSSSLQFSLWCVSVSRLNTQWSQWMLPDVSFDITVTANVNWLIPTRASHVKNRCTQGAQDKSNHRRTFVTLQTLSPQR